MHNHYTILGLTNAATPAEIRRAFRILARRYHPDVNPGESSGEVFKRIAQAHATLSDPEKRRMYDIELERQSESFSETFDRAHEQFRRHQRAAAYKRAQATQTASTNHTTKNSQSEKKPHPPPRFEAPRKKRLSTQKLHALADTSQTVIRKIKDKLWQRSLVKRPFKSTQVARIALLEVSISMLDAIQGIRRAVEIGDDETVRRKISVRIPPGVRTGSIIRFRRKEDPTEEVVVIVRVEHHPWLSISDKGLLMEIPLSVSEAIKGGKIQVPSLGDPLLVTVEPHTQSGREVRLKNQGILKADGSRGDLFIRFIIKLPTTVNGAATMPSGGEYDPYYSIPVRQHLPQNILET